MIFIMIVVTIIGIFMAINYLLDYTLGFLYTSNSASANVQTPWMFPPLDILLEYWIEHLSFPKQKKQAVFHYNIHPILI